MLANSLKLTAREIIFAGITITSESSRNNCKANNMYHIEVYSANRKPMVGDLKFGLLTNRQAGLL